jgi:hypothetical protein
LSPIEISYKNIAGRVDFDKKDKEGKIERERSEKTMLKV